MLAFRDDNRTIKQTFAQLFIRRDDRARCGLSRAWRQEVADKIFDALRAEGRWPVVYIDDMQKVLDRYEPV